MSYHVYTTESFILKGHPLKEADAYYQILTCDLGLITAGARGVRRLESKLSPALVDGSQSTLSLVKGKHAWRIIGAVVIQNTAQEFFGKKPQKVIWFRFLNTVRLMIGGEEKNSKIFELANHFKSALLQRNFSFEELQALERLGIFFLMYELGYAHFRKEYEGFFYADMFSDNAIKQALLQREIITLDINRALAASQS